MFKSQKRTTKILFTTLVTFLCGVLVYAGGKYVYAQNQSDSNNLSLTVIGDGDVKYTFDGVDYTVDKGNTVSQEIPDGKEVKVKVQSKDNTQIESITCNGEDADGIKDSKSWEDTVKFDSDTVKDYKIVFSDVEEQQQDSQTDPNNNPDKSVSENAVADNGNNEIQPQNEETENNANAENSVSDSDDGTTAEAQKKNTKIDGLDIDFNVTDISDETKLIIKEYQAGIYNEQAEKDARKKKAKETKLDKYCDEDYFLTDSYYKKYSEKMLMYDNCVILSRSNLKSVIKANEKAADEYAAKTDKAISTDSSQTEEHSNFFSRLFEKKTASAATLSVKELGYHNVWEGGGYMTNGIWRLSNGHLSFCADGLGAEPNVGSSGNDTIVNNANLRKVLYYGYGGPSDRLSARLGTSGAIVWTDDLVSMAYVGHSVGSQACGGWHWSHYGAAYWRELTSLPDPIQYGYVAHVVSINGGGYNWQGVWHAKQPLAYGVYNPTGKIQVQKSSSNTSFISGKEGYTLAGAVYSVYSNSACTNKVGSVTTNANGTSNTLEVNNGTYYVKETTAPSGYNLDTSVKTVKVNIGQTSTVTSSESPGGAIRIIKKSDGEALTKDNSGYSLSGAKYGVYTDSGCTKLVQTITTGDNGVSGYFGVAGASTFYIKEIKASSGYQLSSKVYTATVNGTTTVDVNVSETPQVLSKPLLIHKTDAKSNALADAQFEVKFYKGIVTNDSAKLSGTPLTWYLKSDSNGDIYLDSAHLVSGKSNSAFLTDASGSPVLTVGTVTVKETQTPSKDYVLDENTYLIQISSKSNASALTYSGSKTVVDKSSWPSKVRFIKYSGLRSTIIYDAVMQGIPLEGTKIKHTLPNGSSEILTYKKSGSTDIISGAYKNNFLEITNLPVGIHKIQEYQSIDSITYALNSSVIQFEVKKDGSVRPYPSSLTKDEMENDGYNELIEDNYLELAMADGYKPFELKVKKIDKDGTPLAGVKFDLYEYNVVGDGSMGSDVIRDNIYSYKGTYTTDNNGIIDIKNLNRYCLTNYKLVESQSLDGYIPSFSSSSNKFTTTDGKVLYSCLGLVTSTNYDTSSKKWTSKVSDFPSIGSSVYKNGTRIGARLDIDSSKSDDDNKKECKEVNNYTGSILGSDLVLNVTLVNCKNSPVDLDVTKADSNENLLSNVSFKLYGEEIEYEQMNNNYDLYGIEDYKNIKYITDTLCTDDTGKLSVTGLKDGDYYLYETSENSTYTEPDSNEVTLNNGKKIKYNMRIVIRNTNYSDERIRVYRVVDGIDELINLSENNKSKTLSNWLENKSGSSVAHLSFVNETKKANLSLKKIDDKNSALKNVEFTMYSDANCTKEVAKATTDKDGVAKFENVMTKDDDFTAYLKETKCPSNVKKPKDKDGKDVVWTFKQTYDNSNRLYSYSLTSTETGNYNYTFTTEKGTTVKYNYLQNVQTIIKNSYKTPKSLYIRKISAGSLDTYDDSLPSGIGNYLDGTTFTHTLPDGKTETLTYKSDSSTDDTDKKEGFMKVTNLTQGKHTIQENTPANSLYAKNPNKLEFTVSSDGSISFSKSDMNVLGGTDTNKIYATSESADDTSNKLMVTFEDEFSPTKLQIHKTDLSGKALQGAVFTIYGDKDLSETVDTATSDADGNVLFSKELKNDKEYWVKETKAPAGYEVQANEFGAPMFYKLMIHSDKDGKKVYLNNELVWNNTNKTELGNDYSINLTNSTTSDKLNMTVKNVVPVKGQKSLTLSVHKTGSGKALSGAKFTLYRERGCYTPINTGTTDSSGNVSFANVLNGDFMEFYMKEVEAPSGYDVNKDADGNSKVWKIQLSADTNGKLSIYVDDVAVVSSDSVTTKGTSEYSSTYKISNDAYNFGMTINDLPKGRPNPLPNTGSVITVILVVAGVAIMLLAKRKKK